MAELPLAQGIDRFKQNEDRMDRFTNGSDTETFVTSSGQNVPTIRKFLKDKNTEINVAADGILAGSVAARNAAQASESAASTSASNAETSSREAAESATAASTSASEASSLVGIAHSALQPNDSLGLSRISTAAGESIDPGHFGGRYLEGKTANRLRIDNPATSDGSNGPRFVLSIEHVFPGGDDLTPGEDDGPDDVRGALHLHARLRDYLTNQKAGEANLISATVEGGVNSDIGGILINGRKVFDDVGGTGYGALTVQELSAVRVNSSGAETSRIQIVLGLQEGAGGAMARRGAGVWVRNEIDANNQGFVAVNGAAAFKYAFAAYTAQDPLARYFAAYWNGDSVIDLGQPSKQVSLLVQTASGALLFQNDANTVNLASLTQVGVFSAYAGVLPSNGSDTITKSFNRLYNVDLGAIAAGATATQDLTLTGVVAGDCVTACWGNDYADDKVIISAVRVTGNNQIRLHFRNVGTTATADLPSQKIIVKIERTGN